MAIDEKANTEFIQKLKEESYNSCYEYNNLMKEGRTGMIVSGTYHGYPVAFKVFYTGIEEISDHFHTERIMNRCIAKRENPFILQCFGYSKTGDNMLGIYELMDNSLFDMLSDRRVSQELDKLERFYIINQVVTAVDYMHKQGYIHNDINLTNLLVKRYQEGSLIKLSDLGSAGLIKRDDIIQFKVMKRSEQTQSKIMMDDPNEIQKDIESLGIVIYEVYHNKIHTKIESGGETKRSIVDYIYGYVKNKLDSQINTVLDQTMNNIISRCTSKDPQERYSSGGELMKGIKTMKKTIDMLKKDGIIGILLNPNSDIFQLSGNNSL